jgi:DNA repair exonuclease SbcCD ATPase subunit
VDIAAQRKRLNKLLSEYAHARRCVVGEKDALTTAQGELTAALQAQKLLQASAEAVQESAHKQIASVVTRCLKAVFGEDAYEFVIRFSQKRGKTEAELLFRRGEMDIDPTSAAGGGVVDVASFALRVACLVLARPHRRRLLCLDEPFKHLSEEYRPAVRGLIETLSTEMGIQFVIVSHDREFQIGNVIDL